jgi:hypothetical protein
MNLASAPLKWNPEMNKTFDLLYFRFFLELSLFPP